MLLALRPLCVLATVAVCLIAAGRLSAGTLAEPGGPVILTVSGNIANTNGNGVARFDRAMLTALSQHVTETDTPWDDGVTRYAGVLGRDLMKALGASGTKVKAVALNDYTVEIPLSDFEAYDVIFALTRNGEEMRVRDKGPVFVIYPFDQHPELDTESIYNRSIWQLKSIVID